MGSSSRISSGSIAHRARKLDALAQAVGQRTSRLVPHVLDLEKVDDVLDLATMLLLLALRAADPIQHAGHEIVAHQMVAANHDVVEHRHVAEQGQILKRAPDAEAGAVVDR